MLKLRFTIFFVIISYCLMAQSPFLDSLKLELKQAKHDSIKCKVLDALIENDYDEAVWPKYNEELGKITLQHTKQVQTPPSQEDIFFLTYLASYYGNIGYIANFHEGNPKKAQEYFNKALTVDQQINNKSGIANSYNALAVMFNHGGDKQKALEYYYKCLKLSEEIDDKRNIAIVLTNIARIQLDDKDFDAAFTSMNRTLKIWEQMGNKNGIANSLNNLATFYNRKKEYQKAKEYYLKSLLVVEETGDKMGIANVTINLGNLISRIGESECDTLDKECFKQSLNEAKEYLLIGLKLHREVGNKQEEAEALINLGWIEKNLGNYKAVKQNGEAALKIGETLGFPLLIRDACSLLFQLYSIEKNWQAAFAYYKTYHLMKDSIDNDEINKAIIKEQLKYQYEKQMVADSIRMGEEQKVIKAKLSEEKTKSYALYGGLIIVILFALFMVNRFKVISKQNKIIETKEKETQKQKELIEEKQKEIVDSINYAKRIQYTLLAQDELLNRNLKQYFIYFKPKDIVSGDFYWATKKNNSFYLAVCDSTGHGVPGAFMSLLNISFLNEAINERNIEAPNKIFDYVRDRLIENMNREGQKDGFDGTLIKIDGSHLSYASANSKPLLIREGQSVELASDRMPVGIGEKSEQFELREIELIKGDQLYLFTDGYIDQFGGPKGKKFKYKQLSDLLLTSSHHTLNEQKQKLSDTFDAWRGNLEQIDDVCVVAIRF